MKFHNLKKSPTTQPVVPVEQTVWIGLQQNRYQRAQPDYPREERYGRKVPRLEYHERGRTRLRHPRSGQPSCPHGEQPGLA